jgi:hypothetical protein
MNSTQPRARYYGEHWEYKSKTEPNIVSSRGDEPGLGNGEGWAKKKESANAQRQRELDK